MGTTYEYIESRGAHGEIANNVVERMVESHREVWFGSDGSGLIRSTRIGWSFFSEQQRTRWETAASRAAREDRAPALDLFAPGCLPGHAPVLQQLVADVGQLPAALERKRRLTVHAIGSS